MSFPRLAGLIVVGFVLFLTMPPSAEAQNLFCPSCSWDVEVTPDGGTIYALPNSSGNTATFFVDNTGNQPDNYNLTCTAPKFGSCSVNPTSLSLDGGESVDVDVTYSVSGLGGLLTMTATGSRTDSGKQTVSLLSPPTITIVAPGWTSGSRSVVHNRQPLLLVTLTPPGGGAVDTTKTVLTWDADTVTSMARHNRGIIEWEVDSLHRLQVGDSALISVRSCTTAGSCKTVIRWAVLLADSKPVLGFTGMPLETLNAGFSAPFGPGVGVMGAEVTTGFSTVPYFSMGKARSSGLVYSTRTSYPRALVNVDLELPWPAGTPDQVKLVLKDGVTGLDSMTLSNPTCSTGAVKRCRATLQGDFAGSSFATPTRKWLTVEARVTEGAVTKISADSVEVVLVDNRTTAYGSGWWPAGISRLVASGGDRILVGASGTATIFRGNGNAYISPPGSFTTLVKTAGGWELRPRGSLARVRYDSQGRIVATEDANGNRDSVAYNGSGAVSKLIDLKGKTITFAYDGNGNISTMTSLTGGAARATKVSVNGTTYQLTYDSLSSLPSRPYTTRYTYQNYPGTGTVVLTRRIGVINDTTRIVYDSGFKRRPKWVLMPLVQRETGSWGHPEIAIVPYEKQGWGSLRSLDSVYVQIKDPRQHWTRSLLNRWGQALKSWDALGVLVEATYDPDGFVIWTQGKTADSSRTWTAYDSLSRVVKTYFVRTAGDTVRGDSLVYDANHRVIKRIDNRGKADSAGYDTDGNLVHARDAEGNVTTYWYRTNGQVDSVRLPGASKSRRMIYEATWGNLWKTLDEASQLTSQRLYDAMGRDTTVDSKIPVKSTGTSVKYQWRRVRQAYDVANQVDSTVLVRTDDCTAPCASPTWPGSLDDTLRTQHLRIIRDRAGRDSIRVTGFGITATRTMYVYDRLGRLMSRRPWTDSMAVKDSLVYDNAGNLKKTITRRGHVIESWYDSRNRDTLMVIPTVGNLKKKYNGPLDQMSRAGWAGSVDSIGKVWGAVAWVYDKRGRLKSDTSWTGPVARVTTHAYDAYERPVTMTDALGTWTTKYETERGMPDTLLTPWSDTLIYTFDSRSRPTAVRITSGPGRMAQFISYTTAGELKELKHTAWPAGQGGYFITRYQRVSDPSGPDTLPGPNLGPLWTELHGASSGLDSLRDSVVYDGWHRVKSFVQRKNSISLPQDSLTYTFDPMGNVKTPNGGEWYNKWTGRLQSRKINSILHAYSYDRAGNLTQETWSGNTRTYQYDALNRLRSVRHNGTLIVRYGYDVLGRRIAKRVYSSITGGTVGLTRYKYHGNHVAFETDSAGSNIGWRYTWGMGTDDLLALRDAAGNHYYTAKDKLGSIRALAERDGTWKYSTSYGPYGEPKTGAGTDPGLRYRWTGREYDAETGWYFHRTRYYAPSMLRFVQEDKIGYGGGANLYAYVAGAVLDARDPSGMFVLYEWLTDSEANCYSAAFCLGIDGTPLGGGGTVGEHRSASLQAWFAGIDNTGTIQIVATIRNGDGSTSQADCATMVSACMAYIASHTDVLTPEERSHLGNMCTSRPASCDATGVFRTGLGGPSVTLGHLIVLSASGDNRRTGRYFTLAHEVYHVFQYEDWGAVVYGFAGIGEQWFRRPVFGRNSVYGWEPGRSFGWYRMEQQATIVAECVVLQRSEACAISPYR